MWFPNKSEKKRAITEKRAFPDVLRLSLPETISLQNSQLLWVTMRLTASLSLPYSGCLGNTHSLSSEVLNLSILQPPSLSSNYIGKKNNNQKTKNKNPLLFAETHL